MKLYHGTTSVCSSKVRVGLAEKGLDFEGCLVNLAKGEQNDPEYLKINPKGVVPSLVVDDLIVVESSVILEFVDALSDENPLLPTDPEGQALARVWLTNCIDIHAAINTLTFSTVARQRILDAKTPEEIEQSIAKMSNPALAAKRRDLLENGVSSTHVDAAFFTLKLLFADMKNALAKHDWLLGSTYGIADAAIISYIDRLDRLGQSGLWAEVAPEVNDWLERNRQRPSYAAAIEHYAGPPQEDGMRAEGLLIWPSLSARWDAFLQGNTL